MSRITSLVAREILDSRGQPTVEVKLGLGAVVAVASVPSGASTGAHEAVELRDGDQTRFGGAGVLCAVANVTGEIARAVVGRDVDQTSLDTLLCQLDGTSNKSRLGANAILAVSLAFARAASMEREVELYEYLGGLIGQPHFALPQPFFNVINGGKHADSGLGIQEFMLAPVGWSDFGQKILATAAVIAELKKLLHERGEVVSVGDEGGFAPQLGSDEAALDILVEAIGAAGYSTEQIKIGLDVAASEWSQLPTSAELIAWYEQLVVKYPVMSIEDGLAEDDWAGFALLNQRLGDKIRVVGDDLLVTNIERIKLAATQRAVNTVLIKPNQIGTVSETVAAVTLTKQQGWAAFASHRSGETTDPFIADLAVGLGCDYLKAGSLARGERVCKYNRLLEIATKLTADVKH